MSASGRLRTDGYWKCRRLWNSRSCWGLLTPEPELREAVGPLPPAPAQDVQLDQPDILWIWDFVVFKRPANVRLLSQLTKIFRKTSPH